MTLQDSIKGIQRREYHALEAAEACAKETDPVKKRKLRLQMENNIEAMHITTRFACSQENDNIELKSIYEKVSESYNPEEYLTVGDCIDMQYLSAKFPNIRLSDETFLS